MTKPLSIGVVCYPSFGGSGVIAAELAAGLARRGHRLHIIASAPPRRSLPQSEGIAFHLVDAAEYPVFENPEYALAVASAIVDVARAEGLDVLHVHYAVPHAASAHLARQILGASAPALVTTLHGTDVTHVGSQPSYRPVTEFAVAASDAITTPSDFLRREAVQRFGIDAASIEVIPNFVDSERFAPVASRDRRRLESYFSEPDDDGPILFHVSNFRPVKHAIELIDVLALLRRALPARMILVGDGPERRRAEERARELSVEDSVRFLGTCADFREALVHADAFLLTSESESFGLAALEAMSAGIPVFAYKVGGLPEVVIEGTGALVDRGDTRELARAVLGAVRDDAVRTRMGEAARARALHFRPELALDGYEMLYRRILERR